MTTQKYIDDNRTETLKKGDTVVMVGCLEAGIPENRKSWKCFTDSFKDRSGEDVVFLEGYSGYFMAKFLHKTTGNA